MKGLSHIYRPDLLQKDILCFYMVLMSIQIIALEGMAISPLKAGAMAFSFPFLFYLLTRSRRDMNMPSSPIPTWSFRSGIILLA